MEPLEVQEETPKVQLEETKRKLHYGLVRVEFMRFSLVLASILSVFILAFRYPNSFGQAALITLSAVPSGYFGLSQSRPRDTKDDYPEN